MVLRYKFSSPNLISPLTKIPIQAHKLFSAHKKYFLHTFHILPKYSPYYYPTWAPKNISHISPINYLGLSHKYYPLSHISSILGFHKNTYHTTTKIGPQNYTISTKRPKLIYLVGKTQKAQQNPLTKLVATRHSKARCYTVPLKARCYTTPLKFVDTRHL